MPNTDTTCCVCLARFEVDNPLPSQLAVSRGWAVISVHDPVHAMAELASRECAQASRSAWGLQRTTGIALAAELHCWPQWPQLRDALARYLPSVSVWDCRDGGLVRIELPQHEVRSAPDESAMSQMQDQSASEESTSDDCQATSISRDELSMLLQGDQHA